MKNFTLTFKTILIVALVTCTTFYGQKKPVKNTLLFGQELRPESTDPDTGVILCGSTEYEQSLQANDPKRMIDAQFEAWIGPLVAAYKSTHSTESQEGGVITIPVVVHIIHSGQAVGTAPNITDSQVLSQITAMNNDFRKVAGTLGGNTSPVGADTMIQFALAKQDPNGNPTNGINHVNMCKDMWSKVDIEAIVKPTTIWDPTQYLNIWTIKFEVTNLLGYAQFPEGSGLTGVPTGGTASTDGIVSKYDAFGSSEFDDGTFILFANYDKGRNATHEVGHWLGLRHIWGDSTCGTDYCDDTPTSHTSNFVCNANIVDCNAIGNEMVQNYMDYTKDACKNIFTIDQKARMTVVMNNALRRVTLKTSTKHEAIPLFANDAEVKFDAFCSIEFTTCTIGSLTQKIIIINRGTSTLTSVSISFTVNGGAAEVYNWTGNLATDKFENVFIPVSSSFNGPMILTVVNANGVADERASNNVSGGTYAPGPLTYGSTDVVFRLQTDNFGSETSWTLKNSSGTLLYSGGPYVNTTDGGPLVIQNWNLPVNDCYKFIINDSYGDGICCAFGNGFYDIKSADGETTLFSSSPFTNYQQKVFIISSPLATNKFDIGESVRVFPNPTIGILNISVSPDLGLPTSYKIINAVGQTILDKLIFSENDLSIDTSALAKGLYFMRVAKDLNVATLRFIKE